MKRTASYTIIEIIVVLVVIGILTTMGMPAYRNFVEESKAKVCDTNLKALQTALEIYVLENETFPAGFSQLQGKYIREAFNKIMSRPGAWKIDFAYAVTGWREYGIAHAAFLKDELAKGNIGLITCPKDAANPSSGGISYGLSSALTEITLSDYKNIPDNAVLIADCDDAVFSGVGSMSRRHILYNIVNKEAYAQMVTKNGKTYKSKDVSLSTTSITKNGASVSIDVVVQ
ncbi:MAG: hypothetical protein PHC33_02480 [Candidatus Omnitrophica bacterium]|nr:hypothetical protein [Candidatus Omnitrophota bacterium]